MKFLYGLPPTPAIQLASARPLNLPSMGVLQVVALGIGLLLLGVFAAVLWACSELEPFLKALQYAADTQHPLVFLAMLPLTLFIHELVHCLAYPRVQHSVIGILPKTGLAYAWNGQPLPRSRMFIAIMAPLVVMTAIMLALYVWVPTVGAHLLPAMLFNIIGSGGDVLVLCYALRQVPSDGWFQLVGMSVWWGKQAEQPVEQPT